MGIGIALFFAEFFFGAVGGLIGDKRRMGPGIGFWCGFLLGPIGLLVVAISAPKEDPHTVMMRTPASAYPVGPPPLPPPPGTPSQWFPDPTGRFEHRYWDGQRWTEHVVRAGQQFGDPI